MTTADTMQDTARGLSLAPVAPLAVDAEGAALLVGVSRRTWDLLTSAERQGAAA